MVFDSWFKVMRNINLQNQIEFHCMKNTKTRSIILTHNYLCKQNQNTKRIKFGLNSKKNRISKIQIPDFHMWSWRERNPSAIPLNISYLIFQNLPNSRITTSKTYCFDYQVASICVVKIQKFQNKSPCLIPKVQTNAFKLLIPIKIMLFFCFLLL